jgi:hypothetical protein
MVRILNLRCEEAMTRERTHDGTVDDRVVPGLHATVMHRR